MTKNVKIDDDTHQKMSIKAAQLGVQKGDLCNALIEAGLVTLTDDELRRWIAGMTTANKQNP